MTLVEAVLSLAILGIIMASVGAATSVLMRLMPRADDPRSVAMDVGFALELLESDLDAAVSVDLAEEEQLRLRVAGLGESGGVVEVLYQFDAGEGTLLRGVGGRDPDQILRGVAEASFGYTVTPRAVGVWGDPVLNASQFGTDGFPCSNMTHTLDPGTAIRQRITPVLGEDESMWRIESVRVRVKQHTLFGPGSCRLGIYLIDDAGEMGKTPIAEQTITIQSLTSSLLSAEWRTVEFSDMPWLDGSSSVAVLLSADGGSLRTHFGMSVAHEPAEIYDASTGSATAVPGIVMCIGLGGQAMEPGEAPPSVDLISEISLRLRHPSLGESLLYDGLLPLPIVIEP